MLRLFMSWPSVYNSSCTDSTSSEKSRVNTSRVRSHASAIVLSDIGLSKRLKSICPRVQTPENITKVTLVDRSNAQCITQPIHSIETHTCHMQSTFRVDISPHTDGTNGEAVAKQPRVATRKSHRKSRAGCLACKQRRIKVGFAIVS